MSLIGGVAIAVLLQLSAMYVPFMQNLMQTVSLTGIQFFYTVLIAFSVIPAVEIAKLLQGNSQEG